MKRFIYGGLSALLMTVAIAPMAKAQGIDRHTTRPATQPNGGLPNIEATDQYHPAPNYQNNSEQNLNQSNSNYGDSNSNNEAADAVNNAVDAAGNAVDNAAGAVGNAINDIGVNSNPPTRRTTQPNGSLPDIEATDQYRPGPDYGRNSNAIGVDQGNQPYYSNSGQSNGAY
jgi:hypothetical protein